MSAADFLDSNVFVYLFDDAEPNKHQTARRIVAGALTSGTAAISFQVVQETLHVITRKLKVVARPEDAEDFLRQTLVPLWRVQPSAPLYLRGMALTQRYGFSFYDSLIVAAALEAGCQRLLTEDLQHGQRIEGLRIENPFRV
jgi:predicted nucleic acid-binding protein